MYRSILYAHDGSPAADQAIPRAADLAVASGAAVLLVHVIQPVGQRLRLLADDSGWLAPPPDAVRMAADIVAYERADAVRQLHRAATRFRELGAHLVRTSVVEGSPEDAIVSIATREGCDLTIIATRGHWGLGRVVESSVARGVVIRSRQPVLLIGPTAAVSDRSARTRHGRGSE